MPETYIPFTSALDHERAVRALQRTEIRFLRQLHYGDVTIDLITVSSVDREAVIQVLEAAGIISGWITDDTYQSIAKVAPRKLRLSLVFIGFVLTVISSWMLIKVIDGRW